jgi:hypothetical protein
MMKRYWFKPKQFWKWFAAYYPVTKEGWVVTIISVAILVVVFLFVDAQSHSASDTLYGIALPYIVVFLIFDIISFRKGEYPEWWKKRGK